jgi:hypothetical protein
MARENPPAHPRKVIVDTIHRLGSEHGVAQVWSDWIEGMALGWANAIGNGKPETRGDTWREREARYMAIVKRYGPEDWRKLAALQDTLVELLEGLEVGEPGTRPAQKQAWNGGGDPLGELYMELELGNDRAGQFFTPWSVCLVMAKLHGIGALVDDIASQGFCKVDDCAVGSGSLLLALAEVAREEGINPQTQIWFSGRDLSSNAAHMAYVNLCLRGLPGVIEHGNTISLEIFGAWITPWHYLRGWPDRLAAAPMVAKMRALIRDVEAMVAKVLPAEEEVVELPEAAEPPDAEKPAVAEAPRAGQMALF